MIVSRMPAYSQGPINTFLETGKFKDHQSIPVDPEEAKTDADVFVTQGRDMIASDNTEVDLDPRPGFIKSEAEFLGPVTCEFVESEDKKSYELFVQFGQGDETAVMYFNNSPQKLDVITVTSPAIEGADEGAQHYDHLDPAKGYITVAN